MRVGSANGAVLLHRVGAHRCVGRGARRCVGGSGPGMVRNGGVTGAAGGAVATAKDLLDAVLDRHDCKLIENISLARLVECASLPVSTTDDPATLPWLSGSALHQQVQSTLPAVAQELS